MTPVKDLLGIGRIPSDRTSATAWLNRQGVTMTSARGRGGLRATVRLSDLPEPERRAYVERHVADLGLPEGTYDDAAHAALLAASPAQRATAERKAEMARYLLSIRAHASWPERIAMVQARFGPMGTSKASLKRLLADVKGIDPINFAPALLSGYRPVSRCAPVSPEAWAFFMTTVRDAAPDFPLEQAWRDVRDVAVKRGWQWPSFSTVWRRWSALPEEQRLHARYGAHATRKRLSQPMHRDKTTVPAYSMLSLDGRTQDFWVDFGDGRAVRPVMLTLVDVATNFVVDWELARSENAAATVRLVKRTCERFGIFDQLYTDNGSAFAGHLVAGGAIHKFRNAGTSGVQPPGICHHLGIRLRFALPANAQAKIAERTFATLSRVIDDRPEFADAHAGHAPGAAPGSDVVPVPFEDVRRVVSREIARHNMETGRRSQGARGRSYQEAFEAGLEARVRRQPTARQLYLSGLVYDVRAVDRNGQLRADGWTYGGPETMTTLLPYHGGGQRVLLGRDPDDFSAPALAFDQAGNLICEGIAPVTPGAYDSTESAQRAAQLRKAASRATAQAEAANQYLDDDAFRRCLDDLPDLDPITPPAPARVVGGRFGAPLRDRDAANVPNAEAVPEEFLRNMDKALAARRGAGR